MITDVGLAKQHNKATRERRDLTFSTAATITHAAPELGIDPNAPRSRRFDIWSMGCILLEFTIWLLYGPQKLKEFSDCLEGSFYTLQTETKDSRTQGQQLLSPKYQPEKRIAKIHPEVDAWISYIKEKDWRYSDNTTIQRLVDLIATRLLKIEVGNPNTANGNGNPALPSGEQTSASQTPSPILDQTFTLEPGSTSQASISIITTTPSGELDPAFQTINPNQNKPERRLTAKLPVDLNSRAYAPEMKGELENILALLRLKQIKPFGSPPSGGQLPPLGPSRGPTVGQDRRHGVRNPTWVS